MSEETKKPETIKLSEQTRKDLQEITRLVGELNSKAQIIIRTYLSALGKEGDYTLLPDMSALVKKKDVKPETVD
jgi:hypothetical protein